MMKKRLAKLEQSIKQQSHGEQKLFIVYRDEDKDLMEISDLNFKGSFDEAHLLMEQYPNSMFVSFGWGLHKELR